MDSRSYPKTTLLRSLARVGRTVLGEPRLGGDASPYPRGSFQVVFKHCAGTAGYSQRLLSWGRGAPTAQDDTCAVSDPRGEGTPPTKFLRSAAFAAAVLLSTPVWAEIHINDLIVHDPHILAEPGTKTYYLCGQYSPKKEWQAKLVSSPAGRGGVIVYASQDLENWSNPKLVFEIPEGFWGDATDAPWAPEVHAWRGKYYLFCTFNDWNTTIDSRPGRPPITKRQTQILVGDSPLGPFRPFANQPTSPPGKMTLDGTFHVDPAGQPWFIYAHEWIQITDGSFEAIRLHPDLSATTGDPLVLFRAGAVDWTKREIRYRSGPPIPGIVTDGASLYRMKSGVLACFWASWSKDRQYAESIAYSDNGSLEGPWWHEPAPILQDDVGHGSVFTAFDGRLLLVIHKYFRQPATRVQIYELEESPNRIRVKRQILGAP